MQINPFHNNTFSDVMLQFQNMLTGLLLEADTVVHNSNNNNMNAYTLHVYVTWARILDYPCPYVRSVTCLNHRLFHVLFLIVLTVKWGCRSPKGPLCSQRPLLYRLVGSGCCKLLVLLPYAKLGTTPWTRTGEFRYSSTHSWPFELSQLGLNGMIPTRNVAA